MAQSFNIRKLKQEFEDIFSLKPNDLGNKHLTFAYKWVTGPLKKMPFIYLLPISFVSAVGLYILFGNLVIKIVSLLQYGF